MRLYGRLVLVEMNAQMSDRVHGTYHSHLFVHNIRYTYIWILLLLFYFFTSIYIIPVTHVVDKKFEKIRYIANKLKYRIRSTWKGI